MKRYANSMRRSVDRNDHNEKIILNFVLRAYENAGDEKNAQRTRKKLENLE